MSSGDYLKSVVYGALDGIITTFAIVCAASGAEQHDSVIVTMGVANLVADSISMGMGDYLSEKAEQDFASLQMEINRKMVRNDPEVLKKRLIQCYVDQGMLQKDASEIISRLAKYDTLFSEHALTFMGGLQPPGDESLSMLKGLTTAASFIVFGSIPLLIFILKDQVSSVFDYHPNSPLAISTVATACTMFLLGALSGSLTERNIIKSGITMTAHGLLAAYAAYVIGQVMEGFYGQRIS
mmetsp:Transcript_10410/g.12647  ORF Transcript_10410/g.12647 Transcript_10410/m.12647 type:complete len:239 (-) Transcript_10410:7-723(-)